MSRRIANDWHRRAAPAGGVRPAPATVLRRYGIPDHRVGASHADTAVLGPGARASPPEVVRGRVRTRIGWGRERKAGGHSAMLSSPVVSRDWSKRGFATVQGKFYRFDRDLVREPREPP